LLSTAASSRRSLPSGRAASPSLSLTGSPSRMPASSQGHRSARSRRSSPPPAKCLFRAPADAGSLSSHGSAAGLRPLSHVGLIPSSWPRPRERHGGPTGPLPRRVRPATGHSVKEPSDAPSMLKPPEPSCWAVASAKAAPRRQTLEAEGQRPPTSRRVLRKVQPPKLSAAPGSSRKDTEASPARSHGFPSESGRPVSAVPCPHAQAKAALEGIPGRMARAPVRTGSLLSARASAGRRLSAAKTIAGNHGGTLSFERSRHRRTGIPSENANSNHGGQDFMFQVRLHSGLEHGPCVGGG
jgi:hypothetical protein